jgi:hypothetical protein
VLLFSELRCQSLMLPDGLLSRQIEVREKRDANDRKQQQKASEK